MTWHTSDQKLLIRFLQPSILSALIAMGVALVAVISLVVANLFNYAQFNDYIDYASKHPSTAQVRFSQASETINSSDVAANVATFVVWGLAGLMGYALIAGLQQGVKNLINFEQNVEYFEQGRGTILREGLLSVFMRLSATILILGLYYLGFNIILPGILVFAQLALSSSFATAACFLFIVFLTIAVSIHISVILMRLFMLRTRVFYGHYYVAE